MTKLKRGDRVEVTSEHPAARGSRGTIVKFLRRRPARMAHTQGRREWRCLAEVRLDRGSTFLTIELRYVAPLGAVDRLAELA